MADAFWSESWRTNEGLLSRLGISLLLSSWNYRFHVLSDSDLKVSEPRSAIMAGQFGLSDDLPEMGLLNGRDSGEKEAAEEGAVLRTWMIMIRSWLATQAGDVKVFGIACGYCLSASLLSIINKWAVTEFPYPGSLTALQYFTSTIAVLILGHFKLLDHDPLTVATMWRFLPAAICYYMSLFTNSELLLHANVDTFIVFRSAVPIFVAVGETFYLNQPWPSLKTWSALATILAGSVLYVVTDSLFTVTAYLWAVMYVASMTIDFVYVKHIVMTVGLSTWGLVLYNNLEALLLFPVELFVMGEVTALIKSTQPSTSSSTAIDWFSIKMWFPILLSCAFGFSISFFGMACRRAISATEFTVLGVVNKLLTVVINLLIWSKHASALGTFGLLICILGSVLFQQSTSSKAKLLPAPAPVAANHGGNEVGQKPPPG